MIFDAIITQFLDLMTWFLTLLPDLPDLSATITDPIDWLISVITDAVGLAQYLLTTPLYLAVIAVIVAIFAFDQIWGITIWCLKKLHIIG